MRKVFKKTGKLLRRLWRGEKLTQVIHDKAEWDRQFKAGQWNFLLRTPYNVAVTAGIVRRLASEQSSFRVLDVGCGNGALGRDLSGIDLSYVGTDISDEALTQAKALYPKGTYKQVAMETDPELEGTFDVIVFSEILLYGNYEQILQVYKPYLKNDGVIIISLYDTWRTKVIWWRIANQINVKESVLVQNRVGGTRWNIKVCTYA